MNDAAAGAPATVIEDRDKTLYWTLSLYVDAANLPADFKQKFDPRRQYDVQRQVFESLRLRNAIEPMFNDIADRERLGVVEDFLLDVEGDHMGEIVQLAIPDVIEWSTEGKRFAAELGVQQPRPLRMRTFWYVHVNGALSYHVSFSYRYQHNAADFYFISLLQKLAAPKEFIRPADGPRGDIDVHTPSPDLFPLHHVEVLKNGKAERFWRFIAERFNRDVVGLFGRVPMSSDRADGKPVKQPGKDYFQSLVRCEPFVETPGLHMPRARSMFVFDDERFVRALLPRSADGESITRTDKVRGNGCGVYPEEVRRRSEQAGEGGCVTLDAALLQSVSEEHLIYFFLAGFNQNIIDFINQEEHEVLDSLDPIYPLEPEHEAESFFVRYANPRAFITFASKLRSLYLGNDYIGTCPYAFLIHVLAMHNEYLVRNYEEAADDLVRQTSGAKDRRREFHAAAERFYAFRKVEYANYYRYRATNVFRYDTEQEVFERLEERRGIQARVDDVERTFANVENFTRDLESRQRQFDTTLFAWIGGVFVFCEIGFLLVEKAGASTPPGAMASFMPDVGLLNFFVLALGLLGGAIAAGTFAWWLWRRL